jgi:hypothetical protein
MILTVTAIDNIQAAGVVFCKDKTSGIILFKNKIMLDALNRDILSADMYIVFSNQFRVL